MQKFFFLISCLFSCVLLSGQQATISADKDIYSLSETIAFTVANGPGNATDWIGIYPIEHQPKDNPSQDWTYVEANGVYPWTNITGFWNNIPTMNSGLHYVAFFELDGYDEVAERDTFYLGKLPQLTTPSATYYKNEEVEIKFTNGPGISGYRIVVYNEGEEPGFGNVVTYDVLGSQLSGSSFFSGLPPGNYYATYLIEDMLWEISNRVSFTVDEEEITEPVFYTQDVEICEGGEGVMVGSSIYNIPGTYIDTLVSFNGADSIVTTNLSVLTLDLTTNLIENESISANQSGAIYQWIDCDADVPINGATTQTFVPETSGNYAVIVSMGSCSDTSDCVAYDIVGIADDFNLNGLHIYPNPASHQLYIEIPASMTGETIVVHNTLGQIVYTAGLYSTFTNIELSLWKEGVYFVRVGDVFVEKVVKF